MAAYLDHIERINPQVNAIVALQDRKGLLAQAADATHSLRAASRSARCTDSHWR